MRIAILAAIGIGAFLLVFLPGYFLVVPSGSDMPEEMTASTSGVTEPAPPGPPPPTR